MMKNVLVLEGNVNVTPFIKARGYTWTKNALHSDKTGRTKDGKARVDKIADKLTLSYELGETPVEALAAMEAVLMQQTFHASGYGVTGSFSKEFYCSSFAPKAAVITDGHEVWESVSFTMIEV
ncbi:MAG: hypothetical protein K2O18_02210 [Oscillospiraceae bacterium]|nr:hypothetical protein [Oscillospiraceae bacterium]